MFLGRALAENRDGHRQLERPLVERDAQRVPNCPVAVDQDRHGPARREVTEVVVITAGNESDDLVLELEPDHRSTAPALQRALEHPDEILGLLLDLEVLADLVVPIRDTGGRFQAATDRLVARTAAHQQRTENQQGQGTGTKLIRHAIKIAKLHKCSQVNLTSNTQRTRAHRFYFREGFFIALSSKTDEFAIGFSHSRLTIDTRCR